mmetsp:Transcript_101051/g.309016  ORF Transcript_101051/g.309016 Transcript_101051/m.309016 type:complete len:366 (-) Transcript_101051:447-1544(-)
MSVSFASEAGPSNSWYAFWYDASSDSAQLRTDRSASGYWPMLKRGTSSTSMMVSKDTFVDNANIKRRERTRASILALSAFRITPRLWNRARHLMIFERRPTRAPTFAARAVRNSTVSMPEPPSVILPAVPNRYDSSNIMDTVPHMSIQKKIDLTYVLSTNSMITTSFAKMSVMTVMSRSKTMIPGSSGTFINVNALPPQSAMVKATTLMATNHFSWTMGRNLCRNFPGRDSVSIRFEMDILGMFDDHRGVAELPGRRGTGFGVPSPQIACLQACQPLDTAVRSSSICHVLALGASEFRLLGHGPAPTKRAAASTSPGDTLVLLVASAEPKDGLGVAYALTSLPRAPAPRSEGAFPISATKSRFSS